MSGASLTSETGATLRAVLSGLDMMERCLLALAALRRRDPVAVRRCVDGARAELRRGVAAAGGLPGLPQGREEVEP